MAKRPRNLRTDTLTRREIQTRTGSIRTIARDLGVSPSTVQKWRKRTTTADLSMGPRTPRAAALSSADVALIVLFRWTTRLSLNDCMRALAPAMPHLRRSTLYRVLRCHGLAEAPPDDGDAEAGRTEFGTFRVTVIDLRLCADICQLVIAVDAASRFAAVDLYRGSDPMTDIPTKLAGIVPYPVRSICWRMLASVAEPTRPCPDDGTPAPQSNPWCAGGVPDVIRTVLSGFKPAADTDLAGVLALLEGGPTPTRSSTRE